MRNKDNYSLRYCGFCNKPFIVLKSRANQSKRGGIYCSYQCKALGEFKKVKFIDANGYVIIPIIKGGKIFQNYEHREIMINWLGRDLKSNEVIHHIDGDKANNKLGNLELKTLSEHVSQHLSRYINTSCAVDGCELNAKRRNLCAKHYLKGWRINNLNPITIKKELEKSYRDRMDRKRDKNGKYEKANN